MKLIEAGPFQMMKEGEQGIEEDLKGIEIFFMVLVVHDTGKRR